MRIKIETIQSDVCVYIVYIYVHSRIKAFNIGKGIDTGSEEVGFCYLFCYLRMGRMGIVIISFESILVGNLLDFR